MINPRHRLCDDMVEVEVEVDCPHCGGRVNVGTIGVGTFVCPLCHEQFELGSDDFSPLDLLAERGLWIGGLVPFLIAFLGIVITLIVAEDGWVALGWSFVFSLAWPVVALAFGLYGYVTARVPLMIGGLLSLAVSTVLLLLLWVSIA